MKEGSQKQMLTCWKLVQASEMVERVQWQGIRSSSSQRGHAPEWQGSGQGCSQDRARWHGSVHGEQPLCGCAVCGRGILQHLTQHKRYSS